MDMDAFYASIEMRDNPDLRNKPLVIARNPRNTGGHGVVATANYIARTYGIYSAMSAQKAYEKCPQAVFVTPNFEKYRQVSNEIHKIFHEYTEMIEYVALDEAYLDVTQNKKQITSAVLIAHQIQQKIFDKTKLTSSTGVSYNKFLAKLASDYSKPAGITVVNKEDIRDFLDPLTIDKFRGVGRKTLPKMYEAKIYCGKDLRKKSEQELVRKFGKIGQQLYYRVRGIDDRPVEWKRQRKSIGKERTFDSALNSSEQVESQFKILANLLVSSLVKQQKHGKTLVVKVRNSNFETITKRITLMDYLPNDEDTIVFYAREIFEEIQEGQIDVRLLGITITNLDKIGFENIKLELK
ncbi:dna polymerase iv [Ligilactobacillus hayakitensis DSM 18933 = JCM 14209]|uniref:DNA polymerase IV n=1 Tax=Ligilactobacillus hayakitensis DSM 18933 = JCM 14209 TaxID=1423755 RepID=A0A0R1WNS1_9LACO|nr:dna polymerase iv [Ligilactobacillus hayakitensis DSM 18933 = JCM 14209]